MEKINLSENVEKGLVLENLKMMFSSSNVNVLLGSGFSTPFLSPLGKDTENDLNNAIKKNDQEKEFEIKKIFFKNSILPVTIIKALGKKPVKAFEKALKNDLVKELGNNEIETFLENLNDDNWNNLFKIFWEDTWDDFKKKFKESFNQIEWENFNKIFYEKNWEKIEDKLREKIPEDKLKHLGKAVEDNVGDFKKKFEESFKVNKWKIFKKHFEQDFGEYDWEKFKEKSNEENWKNNWQNPFDEKTTFIKYLSNIISLRETATVHKMINIFTTNYDNLIETVLETNQIDYFDGFSGRIRPKFSTVNYGKLICKQTEMTGRISEITSVNLFKIHGSLFWKEIGDDIIFEDFTDKIKLLEDKIKPLENDSNETSTDEQTEFLNTYNKLCIINPESNKFKSTVMNSNYYDQIRMFANELERQNTILITFGFSFADEHILQIVKRALSSNQTLTLLLFPYNDDDLKKFEKMFKSYNNVLCYCKKTDDVKVKNFELSDLNKLLEEINDGIK